MMNKAKQYELWMAAARRNGEVLTRFTCPGCGAALHTLTPRSGERWDSTAVCPYCNAPFFKDITTSADGKPVVHTRSVPVRGTVGE